MSKFGWQKYKHASEDYGLKKATKLKSLADRTAVSFTLVSWDTANLEVWPLCPSYDGKIDRSPHLKFPQIFLTWLLMSDLQTWAIVMNLRLFSRSIYSETRVLYDRCPLRLIKCWCQLKRNFKHTWCNQRHNAKRQVSKTSQNNTPSPPKYNLFRWSKCFVFLPSRTVYI